MTFMLEAVRSTLKSIVLCCKKMSCQAHLPDLLVLWRPLHLRVSFGMGL
jgi:hypothetical protein